MNPIIEHHSNLNDPKVETMSDKTLDILSTAELVDRFAERCIEQDRAITRGELQKQIDLYWKIKEVDNELRRRGRGDRLALTALYSHPNMQVRLKAARLTLGLMPVEARQVLEAIARSGRMPQTADAREHLRHLDSGFIKPD